MWWLKPVISGAIGLISANQRKAPPKYQRTAEEQNMLNRLESKAKDGFDVDARIRQQSRPLLDVAQNSKDQAMGRAISSGMQNSIITDELMRKIDRNTQERVTSMSEQIAMQNQSYKDQAQTSIDNFYMNESQRMRQSDEQRRQFKNQQYQDRMGALTGMAEGLINASSIGRDYQQALSNNTLNNTLASNPSQRKVQIMGEMAKLDKNDPQYAFLQNELNLIDQYGD